MIRTSRVKNEATKTPCTAGSLTTPNMAAPHQWTTQHGYTAVSACCIETAAETLSACSKLLRTLLLGSQCPLPQQQPQQQPLSTFSTAFVLPPAPHPLLPTPAFWAPTARRSYASVAATSQHSQPSSSKAFSLPQSLSSTASAPIGMPARPPIPDDGTINPRVNAESGKGSRPGEQKQLARLFKPAPSKELSLPQAPKGQPPRTLQDDGTNNRQAPLVNAESKEDCEADESEDARDQDSDTSSTASSPSPASPVPSSPSSAVSSPARPLPAAFAPSPSAPSPSSAAPEPTHPDFVHRSPIPPPISSPSSPAVPGPTHPSFVHRSPIPGPPSASSLSTPADPKPTHPSLVRNAPLPSWVRSPEGKARYARFDTHVFFQLEGKDYELKLVTFEEKEDGRWWLIEGGNEDDPEIELDFDDDSCMWTHQQFIPRKVEAAFFLANNLPLKDL